MLYTKTITLSMQTWFKNYIYTEEIFSVTWRIDPSYKIDGNPIFKNSKQCEHIEEIKLWEILFYQPGGIGVYRAFDPYCDMLIIVHELFINDTNTIEKYFIEKEFGIIINRLKELGVKVIDQI